MRELIERDRLVVKGRCLEDDGCSASETGHNKEPKEEPIENHSNKFPVFNHLSNYLLF